jgi:4-hydroxybenzoate polyprenyl transferase
MKLSPYLRLMRLHQPTGICLLLWPCLWAVSLASSAMPPLKLVIILVLGSVIMRAAGCIINDLVDVKFDQQVQRTKMRPLASGELTKRQAYGLLAILLIIALGLLLCLNTGAIILGFMSIIPVIIYPFMKRFTYWPQAFLGITFNFGVLISWAAVTGAINLTSIMLYAAGICWTLGYDTIYAYQDRKDDELIGVKSTALYFGENSKEWLRYFYNAMLVLLFLIGKKTGVGNYYYIGFVPMIIYVLWQVATLDINNPQDCMKKFKSNIWLGAIVFVSILAGKI